MEFCVSLIGKGSSFVCNFVACMKRNWKLKCVVLRVLLIHFSEVGKHFIAWIPPRKNIDENFMQRASAV